jgi:tetratricopeptide (TPR) repeat protein
LSRKNGASELIAQLGMEWTALSSSGKYQAARELADKILELAFHESLPTNLAYAFMIKMTTHYRVGELLEAEQYFARGLEFFHVPDFERRAGAVPQTLGNASRNAWFIGQTDAARGRMADALTSTNRSNSPYDIAFAQYMAAILFVLLREYEDAQAQATQSMTLSDKYGFPQFAAISRIALGRARASLGKAAEGSELIRDGLQAMAQTGSRVAITMYLTWQAEAEALNGRFDDALETIERAANANLEERFYLPEMIRTRGELLLSKNDTPAAESSFREAIILSKKMGARSFELRAATNLAHIHAAKGDFPNARALLFPLCESLAEGQMTRDLKDARFLLQQWDLAQ